MGPWCWIGWSGQWASKAGGGLPVQVSCGWLALVGKGGCFCAGCLRILCGVIERNTRRNLVKQEDTVMAEADVSLNWDISTKCENGLSREIR